MFEEETRFLERVERKDDPANQRKILTEKDVEALTQAYPGIPQDYLAYMREIGFGSVRESQYFVHEGLSWCDEEPLFNWFKTNGRRLLVFGSNSMGDLWAFDVDNKYQVCELLHESMDVCSFEGSFKDFIRQEML